MRSFQLSPFAHYTATLRLGLPIAVGQLGVIIVGFADTAMVGHYSTDALAAAAFVNNLFTLVTFILMGYSYGLTPLVSGLYGCGKQEEAGGVLKNALGAGLLFSAVLSVVMGVLYFFLGYMGQPSELLPLIRPYYLLGLAGIAFVLLFNVLRQFCDGITDTSVGMWALLAGNALNVLGNWLLIGGVGPFPELGLMGAGWATLASRVLMVAVLAGFLLWRKRYARFRTGFSGTRLSRSEMLHINRVSLPVSIQMGLETGSFTFSAVMAGWLGAVELAAYQILVTVGTLGFLFYYSFAAGASIRVAAFVGMGNWQQVRHAERASRHILCALAAIASVCILLFARPLVSVFTADVRVLTVALAMIVPLVVYQFGDAMQICYANVLRGTGQVMSMMKVAFISYILINIPLTYLLAFPIGLGLQGIYVAFSFGLFTAALLFVRKFHKVLRSHGVQ